MRCSRLSPASAASSVRTSTGPSPMPCLASISEVVAGSVLRSGFTHSARPRPSTRPTPVRPRPASPPAPPSRRLCSTVAEILSTSPVKRALPLFQPAQRLLQQASLRLPAAPQSLSLCFPCHSFLGFPVPVDSFVALTSQTAANLANKKRLRIRGASLLTRCQLSLPLTC
jgi:hypothetical protein